MSHTYNPNELIRFLRESAMEARQQARQAGDAAGLYVKDSERYDASADFIERFMPKARPSSPPPPPPPPANITYNEGTQRPVERNS